MANDSPEVTAPEVEVIQDPKHPNEVKIQWAEGKGHSVKSWWLYIGTRSENGASMLEIVNGPMGKATEVLVPMERFPRGVEAYIQVEGRINTHDQNGHALEVGILSNEISWTRLGLDLSTAAHSMKTKGIEIESPSIQAHL
jgi:hypothetical protein